MFGFRKKAHSNSANPREGARPRLSTSGAHPVDVLAAFAPKELALREVISSMLLDFTGGGIISSSESVNAIQRPPTQSESEQMLEVAESLIDCAKLRGEMSDGLVHGAFVVAMEDFTGKPFTEAVESQRAISRACSAAVYELVGMGREDEALGAALIACVLYRNAEKWELTRVN
jgi:hypothetical protein